MTGECEWSFVWVILHISMISVINAGTIPETPCSDYSNNKSLPIVTFCADSQASGGIIVLDGYFADIQSDVSCNCIIKSKGNQTLQIARVYDMLIGNIPNDCNSKIKVQSISTTQSFVIMCQGSGTMIVGANEDVNVTLLKNGSPSNTRYCLTLSTGIDAICYSNTMTTTQLSATTTESKEIIFSTDSIVSTSREQHMTSTQGSNTNIFLTSKKIVLSTAANSDSLNDDNNILYMYVGGGAGGGAVVVIIIIVLVVIGCKRRHKKTLNENQESQQHDDDDELKYNVLYMSSGNSHGTRSNRLEDNRTSYDIDGNYNMVEMDDNSTPKQENQVDNSFKPEIAPKPTNSSSSKRRSRPQNSSVKHISVGDGGCEYAVVNKANNSDDKQTTKPRKSFENTNAAVSKTSQASKGKSTVDNTYAVVDKTKKLKN